MTRYYVMVQDFGVVGHPFEAADPSVAEHVGQQYGRVLGIIPADGRLRVDQCVLVDGTGQCHDLWFRIVHPSHSLPGFGHHCPGFRQVQL